VFSTIILQKKLSLLDILKNIRCQANHAPPLGISRRKRFNEKRLILLLLSCFSLILLLSSAPSAGALAESEPEEMMVIEVIREPSSPLFGVEGEGVDGAEDGDGDRAGARAGAGDRAGTEDGDGAGDGAESEAGVEAFAFAAFSSFSSSRVLTQGTDAAALALAAACWARRRASALTSGRSGTRDG
jgi:hypothetical protein